MRRILFVLQFALSLAASLAATAAFGLIYSVDDGTPESSLATILQIPRPQPPGDYRLANEFVVVPGGETITHVSVFWAASSALFGLSVHLWPAAEPGFIPPINLPGLPPIPGQTFKRIGLPIS